METTIDFNKATCDSCGDSIDEVVHKVDLNT